MKLYPFLFLNFSHGQEFPDLELGRNGIGQEWCTVQRAVHLCRDDSDMKYRQCLAEFGCYGGDITTNPNSRCTQERKSACWYEHQFRRDDCPCGRGVDGCGSGDWCRGKSNSILLTREGDPETVIFSHVMNPAGSEDHFGHDKIYSGAGDWNVKMSQMSCSFQLCDRMFIVGGSGSTDQGYDNFELLFGPPQWIAKLERLPNLPIRFEEGTCHGYSPSDGIICSSKYYQGTSNAGRECYHTTDGRTYKPTGYLQNDHNQGR